MRKLGLLFVLASAASLTACGSDPPANDSEGAEPSSGSESTATTATTGEPTPTTGDALVCTPGVERCGDASTREVCAPTGLEWEAQPCGAHQSCTQSGADAVASCVGPCEVAGDTPSSIGCEFLAIRVRSSNGGKDPAEFYDALMVGNPDDETVEVQLSYAPTGSHTEAPLGEPVLLAPGTAHIFEMTSDAIAGFSAFRNGGIYRVRSDLPVVAYLHSPLKNSLSNDSSLLLPVKTLRQEYVVASYPAYVDPDEPLGYGGRPSYFNVIALADETNIEWVPRRTSFGNGLNVPEVLAGAVGMVELFGLDVLQVGAKTPENFDFAEQDISGTVVRADKPIWVLGGAACARVPYEATSSCNHLQEQMIPTEYWGMQYVAAHSPLRAGEKHHWRIYAGADNLQVVTDPHQFGGTFKFEKKGDFADLVVENGRSFTFQGTGPFMPVQYLASGSEAAGIGDPAMYQTIPVEQYLDRYVFVTGVGYAQNYAQVVRRMDAADVFINGVKVEGYYPVVGKSLNYEIADVPLGPGDEPKVHFATSEDPFSVTVLGYTAAGEGGSAYAYPGGMGLRSINTQ